MIKIVKNIIKGSFEAKQYFEKQKGITLFEKVIKYNDKESEEEHEDEDN